MLKSQELKAEFAELQGQMRDMVEAKQEVPAEMQAKLEGLKAEYESQKAVELAAKNKSNNFNMEDKKMDKKLFNASLKAALLGKQDENFDQFFNSAVPNDGAVGSEGGYLVPEELLPLAENNAFDVDLRTICTTVAVSTRSGKVPTINYGAKDVALVAFDENTSITQDAAVFGAQNYTLASKGAIIPVSRELLMDAQADVLGVIGKLFNRVYMQDVNAAIASLVETDAASVGTGLTAAAAIDAIKEAVIKLPAANAAATVVMPKSTWAALATAKNADGEYLLSRDANGAAVKQIEGRPVVAVEDGIMTAKTVLVGDFSAVYHIAYPSIEIASSAEAGFGSNSVLVRAVCRYTNIDVFAAAFSKLTIA